MKHLTLKNTVRVTDLIIFLLFALQVLFLVFFFVASPDLHFPRLALMSSFLIFSLVVAYAGWRMFRCVDQASVANFCFAVSGAVIYLVAPLLSQQFDSASLAPVFIGLGLFFGLYLSLVKPLTRLVLYSGEAL